VIRNIELNSREYEIIQDALVIAKNHVMGVLSPLALTEDETKMLIEEYLNLIKRFKEHDTVKGAGVYIDGERQ
jgi:hypothetical protein